MPEVVLLRNQVLLMSFIGRDGRPAPKLKEAAERMSAEELGTAYNQVNEKYVVKHKSAKLIKT